MYDGLLMSTAYRNSRYNSWNLDCVEGKTETFLICKYWKGSPWIARERRSQACQKYKQLAFFPSTSDGLVGLTAGT